MSLKREEQRVAEENAKRDDLSEQEKQRLLTELERLRVVEYSSVAREYAKNQSKTINYNNINWR